MTNPAQSVLLGKYALSERLADTRSGALWHAEDLRLGEPVAVRVLPPLDDQGPIRRRFKRDFSALAGIEHPRLARLLDCDLTAQGQPVVVSAPATGRPLSRILQAPVDVADAERWLLGILDGLAACHEIGLAHRDLSPSSVWIDAVDGQSEATVHDFGLTRLLAGSQGAMTLNGEIYGSPRFMAPEQWAGDPVDARADVYSAALIGYCLLLGDHFVPASDPMSIHAAHLNAARPRLIVSADGAPIPALLADAIAKAAAADPAERFSDAAQMASAIRGERLSATTSISGLIEDWDEPTEVQAAPTDIQTTRFNAEALRFDAELFDDRTEVIEAPSALQRTPAPVRDPSSENLVGGRSGAIQAIDRRAFEAALSAASRGEPIPQQTRDTLPEESMSEPAVNDRPTQPDAAPTPTFTRDEPLQTDKKSMRAWLMIYFTILMIGVVWAVLR